jgi:predicted O-methyltransferase YrrM
MPDPEGMALHEAALEAAASGLGPLLEVGTYCGKSAVYLGAGAAAAGGLLFSVDHHRGSEELQSGWPDHDPEVVGPGTGTIDTLPWARRTVRAAGLESAVVLVVGESSTVARAWGTPLSLLFIDGGHGAEVASADFASWPPKVAGGGWLAVHDVFSDPADGGQVPWDQYRRLLAGGEFTEVYCVGSLRLARRRRPPPAPPRRPAPRLGPPPGQRSSV